MPRTPVPQPSCSVADFDRTLILALEVSEKSWVVAAQVPGPQASKPRRTLSPSAEALLQAIEAYRAGAAKAGRAVERVVLVYEAGYSGFWLARWLARQLQALVENKAAPAEMARGKRRRKRKPLAWALEGRMTEHHRDVLATVAVTLIALDGGTPM